MFDILSQDRFHIRQGSENKKQVLSVVWRGWLTLYLKKLRAVLFKNNSSSFNRPEGHEAKQLWQNRPFSTISALFPIHFSLDHDLGYTFSASYARAGQALIQMSQFSQGLKFFKRESGFKRTSVRIAPRIIRLPNSG